MSSSPTAQAATGTSDAAGNLSIAFPSVPTGHVWTGTLAIPSAPPAAVLGFYIGAALGGAAGAPWGAFKGAAAGNIQAWGGDSIQIIGTGLTPLTQYAAWFIGSDTPTHEAIPISPFPQAPASTATSLIVISGGVQPYCIPSLANFAAMSSAGVWTYGAWVQIGTTAAAGGLGSAVTEIVAAQTGLAAQFNIELSYGASGGANLLGTWAFSVGGNNATAIVLPQPVLLSAGVKVWGRCADSVGTSIAVALNLFQVTGQPSFA